MKAKTDQRAMEALLLARYVWIVIAVACAVAALGLAGAVLLGLVMLGVELGCVYFGKRVIRSHNEQATQAVVYAMGRSLADNAIKQITKDRDELRAKVAMRQGKGEVRH